MLIMPVIRLIALFWALRPTASIVLWDMDKTNLCNAFYIQFRQGFAKETFSYDEYLKSYNIQY